MMKEKILKIGIIVVGTLCLYAFLAIRILPMFNFAVREKMIPEYWDRTKYGELYYSNYIKVFREEGIPLAKKKFQHKDKHATLEDADIITFGDSFFDISRDAQFPELLADSTGEKVNFHSGDYPLSYLKLKGYTNSEPKLLFYERVERYIPFIFSNNYGFDETMLTKDTRSNFRKKVANARDYIFYDRTEELYDAFLKKSILTNSIYTWIATIKFRWFKFLSPSTPKYKLNYAGKPWLFYVDQVNDQPTSYYYQHSQEEIDAIADNIKILSDTLKEEYNLTLVFLPLPAKYTIMHYILNDDDYSNFLPKLYNALEKRDVKFVKVFQEMQEADEILFYGSDSHWNEKGILLTIQKTMQYLRNENLLNQEYTE